MKNDTLGLYGPEDSKYLRLVARRAAVNGIKTAWVFGPTPGCAAGVLWYICSLTRERRVCIIGRGHAVQWMYRVMLCYNYYVDQCRSTALDMDYRVSRADIIVNSANAVTEKVLGAVPASAIIIDISGSMEPLRDRVADYMPRDYVGRWNIEELLRRVRVRIEEEKNE